MLSLPEACSYVCTAPWLKNLNVYMDVGAAWGLYSITGWFIDTLAPTMAEFSLDSCIALTRTWSCPVAPFEVQIR